MMLNMLKQAFLGAKSERQNPSNNGTSTATGQPTSPVQRPTPPAEEKEYGCVNSEMSTTTAIADDNAAETNREKSSLSQVTTNAVNAVIDLTESDVDGEEDGVVDTFRRPHNKQKRIIHDDDEDDPPVSKKVKAEDLETLITGKSNTTAKGVKGSRISSESHVPPLAEDGKRAAVLALESATETRTDRTLKGSNNSANSSNGLLASAGKKTSKAPPRAQEPTRVSKPDFPAKQSEPKSMIPVATAASRPAAFQHALMLNENNEKSDTTARKRRPSLRSKEVSSNLKPPPRYSKEVPVNAADHNEQGMNLPSSDPVFYKDPILNTLEMEVLWLGVESIYCAPETSCRTIQWDFVWQHASPSLLVELRKLQHQTESEEERLNELIRMDDWLVKRRFEFLREQCTLALMRGVRRPSMALTIAKCSMEHRQRQDI